MRGGGVAAALAGVTLAVLAAYSVPGGSPDVAIRGCRAAAGDTLACGTVRVKLRGYDTSGLCPEESAAAQKQLQAALDAGDLTLELAGVDVRGRVLADGWAGPRRLVNLMRRWHRPGACSDAGPD